MMVRAWKIVVETRGETRGWESVSEEDGMEVLETVIVRGEHIGKSASEGNNDGWNLLDSMNGNITVAELMS